MAARVVGVFVQAQRVARLALRGRVGIAARVNEPPLISLCDVSCLRVEEDVETSVEIAALSVERGSVTVLAGEAGSGKNLLLRLLGLLERPDAGEIIFEGQPTAQMTDDARATLRSRRCGYVFAAPFLLPSFTVLENIAMPIFKTCQLTPEEARDRTEEVLEFTGLQEVATSYDVPVSLQYRASLARALASQPAVIFVENLDAVIAQDAAGGIGELLHSAAQQYGVAVVASAPLDGVRLPGERRIEIADGRLTQEVAP